MTDLLVHGFSDHENGHGYLMTTRPIDNSPAWRTRLYRIYFEQIQPIDQPLREESLAFVYHRLEGNGEFDWNQIYRYFSGYRGIPTYEGPEPLSLELQDLLGPRAIAQIRYSVKHYTGHFKIQCPVEFNNPVELLRMAHFDGIPHMVRRPGGRIRGDHDF